jgi:hypothetical protein
MKKAIKSNSEVVLTMLYFTTFAALLFLIR